MYRKQAKLSSSVISRQKATRECVCKEIYMNIYYNNKSDMSVSASVTVMHNNEKSTTAK